MTEHECIIGLFLWDENFLVTLTDIKKQLAETIEYNKYVEREAEGWPYERPDADTIRKLKRTEYPLDSFFDRRRKSPLYHFDYCPICGKKIDWKAMRDAE